MPTNDQSFRGVVVEKLQHATCSIQIYVVLFRVAFGFLFDPQLWASLRYALHMQWWGEVPQAWDERNTEP